MKSRDSNIELLRIIAMTFIVIGHISLHAQKGDTVTHDYITSITITGVNLFLLITGYYGLKFKWKSFLNIVGAIIFYSILSIILNFAIYKHTPNFGQIVLATITPPFGHTAYWFANNYIILMLLSPALNIIRKNAENRELIRITSILVILSCITGFIFKNMINHNGYCIMQFITMYFIGATINRFHISSNVNSRKFAVLYVFSTIVILFQCIFDIGSVYNNNPVVIIAAIALFCLVMGIKFHSNKINMLAQCMFYIYLIQDSSFGFNIYKELYQFGKEEDFCSIKYFAILGIYILVLFASAFFLERIRKFVMQRPIDAISYQLENLNKTIFRKYK